MTKNEKQSFWFGISVGAAGTTILALILTEWQEPIAGGFLLIAGAVSAFLWLSRSKAQRPAVYKFRQLASLSARQSL